MQVHLAMQFQNMCWGRDVPEQVAGLTDCSPCCVQHPEEQGHLAGQAELLFRVWSDGQHDRPDGRYKKQHLQEMKQQFQSPICSNKCTPEAVMCPVSRYWYMVLITSACKGHK